MAIDKKLIFWKKQSTFNAPSSPTDTTGSVMWYSIVFFKDTGQIWTNGTYYNCGVWGTPTTNYIPLTIGGVTVNLSKDGHTHSYLPLSGGQLTGQLSLLQGAGGGIIFPNDSFGGGGDSASIKLLNPIGGESTEMTFTMTNDADDIINFSVPSIDGVKVNRYTVWHAGNLNPSNYLPLSGGTLTGELTLSRAGLTTDNFIKFKNDTQNCYFGVRNPYGSFGLTFVSPDGTYNKVWHAGNDGAGSGLDADTLDGLHGLDYKNDWTATITIGAWSRLCFAKAIELGGSFILTIQYTRYDVVADNTFLIQFGHYYSGQIITLGTHGYTQVQLRLISNNGIDVYIELLDTGGGSGTQSVKCSATKISCTLTTYSTYTATVAGTQLAYTQTVYNKLKVNDNTVAFTSDNVASATKLQTSRTIWGQSFNGEGDVTGDLTIPDTNTLRVAKLNTSDYSTMAFNSRAWQTAQGVNGKAFVFTTHTNSGFGGYESLIINYGESGSILLKPTGDGNVGIGTTSPSYKLDVNGTGRYTGNVTAPTFIGNLNGNASTAYQTTAYVAAGTTHNLLYSLMADNDYFRVMVGGASNGGYAEIATGDDGSEPIYIRQYSGHFDQLLRTATLLDANGNTNFPGSLSASRVIAGYDAGVAGSVSCSNWFRSNGATGWFNETYGGGIHMEDSTYVRVYNSKAFKVDSTASDSITTAGGVTAANFYGNINASYLTGTVANDRLPQRLRNYTSQYSVDPNTFKESGFAYTTTNLPANVNDANILSVSHTSGGWGHQLAFKFGGSGIGGSGYDGKDIYTRTYNSSTGAWTSWYGLLSTGNYSNVLDSRYRPMGGSWAGNSVPGTREFGFITNDGSGEVAFKSNSGTMNMIIDGNIYVTDNSYQVIHAGNIASQSVSYASSSGNADTVDSLHQTSFLRCDSASSSNVLNGNFAIGNASGRNFIQSHNSQPLDLNPLGNLVTVNNYSIWHSGNFNPSNYLPLSGGTMTGSPYIYFPASANTSNLPDSTPTGLTYGRLQSFGTMTICGDTDGSTTEYVNITAGYSVANATAANGLSIGYSTLKWKGNTVWHAGNDGAGSGLDADTLDGLHNTSFLRCDSASASNPTNGNFAIGTDSTHNFIQSHAGKPLHLNELGNYVYINNVLAATINSNVASATKLANTRYIWGQAFNGEANVSGDMTGVSQISLSNGDGTANTITPVNNSGNAGLVIKGGNYYSYLNLRASYNTFDHITMVGGYIIEPSITLNKFSSKDVISNTATYAATYANISGKISATTGIFSNLTANYIPKHTAGGLTNGSIYDDGSIVSIAPTGAKVRLNSGDRFLEIDGYTNSKITLSGKTGSPIEIKTEGNSNQILLGTNGCVSIGTTTDAGYKLDVNGTGRFTGNMTLNGYLQVQGGSSVPGIKSSYYGDIGMYFGDKLQYQSTSGIKEFIMTTRLYNINPSSPSYAQYNRVPVILWHGRVTITSSTVLFLMYNSGGISLTGSRLSTGTATLTMNAHSGALLPTSYSEYMVVATGLGTANTTGSTAYVTIPDTYKYSTNFRIVIADDSTANDGYAEIMIIKVMDPTYYAS